MSKQMKWGLATLILLLGIAAVFLFIDKDTEIEPKMTLGQPTKDLLKQDVKWTNNLVIADTQKPPSPSESYETGHWDGDYWHGTAPSDTQPSGGGNGVTRQGRRYLKNTAWAHRKEANVTPTGPSLELDWSDINTMMGTVDWYDPRTWESYRNFWGFDRPHVRPDGSVPWRAVVDNRGTPLQMFENVALVTEYNVRIGFRPTPEQLKQYNALQADYKSVLISSDSSTAETLKQEINTLVASAQGEIPNPASYFIQFYGAPYKQGERTPPEVYKERQTVAIKNLYKRLGIQHLYELYEPK